MNLTENLYKILIAGGSYITILKGLWMTIQGSFISVLLGTLLGGLICLLRMRKNVVIRTATAAYIAFLRGTPVLMLLLLLYYGVFARAGLPSYYFAANAENRKTSLPVSYRKPHSVDQRCGLCHNYRPYQGH